MKDDEWEVSTVDARRQMLEPHLSIWYVDTLKRSRAYLSAEAYKLLGRPAYVKLLISKTSHHKMKIVPTIESDKHGRRVTVHGTSAYSIGGAPKLIKQHNMPIGRYKMCKDGVFEWADK